MSEQRTKDPMRLAWLAANAFFWLGHFWSRAIVNHWPDAWERSGMAMAGVYSALMRRSFLLSEKYSLGIWK